MLGRLFLLAVIVGTASTPMTWAQGAKEGIISSAPWAKAIRVSDEELIELVTEGIKKSPTLRSLADRLSTSDVIVYVRPDVTATGKTQGRLGFISSSGGYRYLVIHVPTAPAKSQRVAILGHLLQHTVAIADAPAVVDAVTLKKEFERIGYVQQSSARGLSLDSPAAGQVKSKILQEMSGS